MGGAANVFLTCEEARLAIVFDLRSYGAQDEVARAVLRVLGAGDAGGSAAPATGAGWARALAPDTAARVGWGPGEDRGATPDPGAKQGPEPASGLETVLGLDVAPGLEVGAGPGGVSRLEAVPCRGALPDETFTAWAAGRIEGLLESLRPPPEVLARLCSLVFGQAARAAADSDGGPAGVLLETGMEGFACTRCGRCCLELDFHRECTAEDVALWRERGREDILAWVGEEQGPDGPVYRIWKYPGTPLYAESCPFLRRVPGDTAFVCAIHDVKPEICRSYPGLRKHALMTGCRGFPRD